MFIEGAPGFHDKQGPWFLEKVLDGGYLSVLLSGTLLLNAAASSSVCSESNEVSCCRLGHISVTALMQFSCRLHWLLVPFLLLWKKQGREGSTLHFSDALIIRSPFVPLILHVALAKGGIPVTLCEGAKHPYIKECTVPVTSPEVICCNI